MDVDRIVREMDVKTLQDNIMHVTFSNIEAELVSVLIPDCTFIQILPLKPEEHIG